MSSPLTITTPTVGADSGLWGAELNTALSSMVTRQNGHALQHKPGGFDDLSGSYVGALDPAKLPKFRLAMANYRAGLSDVKILCCGDSTTSGFGAGNPPNINSWTSRLAAILSGKLGPAANGLALPPLTPDTDTRWTVGTNWSNFAGYSFANLASFFNSAGSGTLTYADSRVNADRFDIYYAISSGFATFTAQATGGASSGTINSGSGGPGVAKLTVSAGSAATTNSVVITATSAANLLILAVEPWLSTTKTIRVGNAGRNGTTTASYIQNALNFTTPNMIPAYAPDLTIISFGINDAGGTPATVAAFQASMATLIGYARQTGDVLLWIPQFVNDAGREAVLSTYRAAYPNIASANGCPAPVDISKRLGPYAGATSMYFDNYHLNGPGYWDEGSALASLLASQF
jgi:lysophospholipase L1-like esterase